MMWHGEWSGADWALMSLGMLALWTVVVAAALWVGRALLGRRDRGSEQGPVRRNEPDGGAARARGILDERYARGELSEQEYRARRDMLAER